MRNTLRLRQLLKTRTFTDECLFRFQYFLSNRPSCPSGPSWPTTIEQQRDAHRLTALSISHLSILHCQLTFNKTIKGRPVLAIFTSIRMEHCTMLKLLHKRVLFSKMRQDCRCQSSLYLIAYKGVKTDQPFIVNYFLSLIVYFMSWISKLAMKLSQSLNNCVPLKALTKDTLIGHCPLSWRLNTVTTGCVHI